VVEPTSLWWCGLCAHTPGARACMSALREHCRGHLWCVFGAGGERDIGKRPLMGAIAERLADHVILTDDIRVTKMQLRSSWTSLPAWKTQTPSMCSATVARRLRRCCPQQRSRHRADRWQGSRDYQQVGDQRLHFSDREQVRALLGDDVP